MRIHKHWTTPQATLMRVALCPCQYQPEDPLVIEGRKRAQESKSPLFFLFLSWSVRPSPSAGENRNHRDVIDIYY